MATVRERVEERWPSLVFLLDHHEIGPLLRRAVDPDDPLSASSFQSRLIATRWFRSRSEAERKWYVRQATDPGQAKRDRQEYATILRQSAAQLGVKLAPHQVKFLTAAGLAQGLDPSSYEVRQHLVKLAKSGGVRAGPGSLQSAQHAVNNVAHGEYFQPLSMRAVAMWANQIALGNRTLDDLRTHLAKRAVHRFPHMREQLAAGASVADVVGPLRQAVAEELELASPDLINVKKGKWSKLTGIRDPKTGKMRMPTESEARVMARSQPQWWQTTNGRAADAGMTRALLQAFGKRA